MKERKGRNNFTNVSSQVKVKYKKKIKQQEIFWGRKQGVKGKRNVTIEESELEVQGFQAKRHKMSDEFQLIKPTINCTGIRRKQRLQGKQQWYQPQAQGFKDGADCTRCGEELSKADNMKVIESDASAFYPLQSVGLKLTFPFFLSLETHICD